MTANQIPASGSTLYASRSGVYRYNSASTQDIFQKPKEQKYYPVVDLNNPVGTFTGQTSENGGQRWFQVDWVNQYVWHRFPASDQTIISPQKSWVLASDVKAVSATQEQQQKAAEQNQQGQKITDAALGLIGGGTVANNAPSGNNQIGFYVFLAVLVVLVIWYFNRSNSGRSRSKKNLT